MKPCAAIHKTPRSGSCTLRCRPCDETPANQAAGAVICQVLLRRVSCDETNESIGVDNVLTG